MMYKEGDILLCKKNYLKNENVVGRKRKIIAIQEVIVFEKGNYYTINTIESNSFYDDRYDKHRIEFKSDKFVKFIEFIGNIENYLGEYFLTKQEERKLKLERLNNV